MIRNLDNRVEGWSRRESRGPAKGHDLSDSLPYPFVTVGMEQVFSDKNVLEIGPGNGRQYEAVRNEARTYYIADICANVLNEPVFDNADGKLLIRDWGQDFGITFNLIHFWYVLHHVRKDEMREFFGFVRRHLTDNGLVLFNCPQPINVQGHADGDGVGTTYSDKEVVLWAIHHERLEMLATVKVDLKSTGYVFLLRAC